MKATNQPVSDAMVDAYRDIMQIKRNLAAQDAKAPPVGITAGAGVDPRKVCKPGKRLRNWHRHAGGTAIVGSLLFYARRIAEQNSSEGAIAKRWLAA